MSNKKQTSVEFLAEALSIHFTQEQQMQFFGLFIQANELHRQEIIYAYEVGFSDGWNDVKYDKPKYSDAEQYYKDNYE